MGYSSYTDRNSLEDAGNGQPSTAFYSPFFLQKQTGNKFVFQNDKKMEVDLNATASPKEDRWIDYSDQGQNETLQEYEQEDIFPTSTSTILPNITEFDLRYFDSSGATLEQFLNSNGTLVFGNNTVLEEASEEFEYYSSTEVYKHILSFGNETEKYPESVGVLFDAPEYAVFGAVLLLSAAIGVFYGCFGKGQKSTAEYLIANRQLSTVPAALSLLCSFISAITILGNPIEIYLYGSSYGLIIFSFVPLTISLAYFYVPVFFNLQLVSAYEYFELRFNRSVRTIVSFVGILHYIVYMSIVVYGPALAIGQVTGINTRMSTIVIFTVCIFYSTLGGLKGVIASDVLQALVMIGSLITIVCKGTVDLGGPQAVWDISDRFNRTQFLNLDIDPRTRHTLFTSMIGGYLQWLTIFAATHSQVQRYLSMPSLASIRRALLLNLIGFTVVFGLCYWCGLMLFAKYHDCNPIQSGKVTRSDQMLPLFVMEFMGDYPGIPGLFVAGITCASLSSVSTGLNTLSAIVTYDYLKHWMPNLADVTLLRFSKTLCVIFGVLSLGLMFVAETLGDILPAAFFISGIVLGPTLGIFTNGMFFPWANSKGSILGLLTSVFIMITLTVGNQLAAFEGLLRDQTLPGLSTDGCPASVLLNSFPFEHNETFRNVSNVYQNATSAANSQIGDNFEEWGSTFLINLFSISYMWYPAIGCILAVFFGLLFSIIIGSCENFKPVNPDHISPPMLWFWINLFPSHSLKWIDIDMEEYQFRSSASSNSASMSIRSPDFTFKKESVCDVQLKRLSILPHQIRFPLPPLPPQGPAGPDSTSTIGISNTTDSLT